MTCLGTPLASCTGPSECVPRPKQREDVGGCKAELHFRAQQRPWEQSLGSSPQGGAISLVTSPGLFPEKTCTSFCSYAQPVVPWERGWVVIFHFQKSSRGKNNLSGLEGKPDKSPAPIDPSSSRPVQQEAPGALHGHCHPASHAYLFRSYQGKELGGGGANSMAPTLQSLCSPSSCLPAKWLSFLLLHPTQARSLGPLWILLPL